MLVFKGFSMSRGLSAWFLACAMALSPLALPPSALAAAETKSKPATPAKAKAAKPSAKTKAAKPPAKAKSAARTLKRSATRNPAIVAAEAGNWREVQKAIAAAPKSSLAKLLTWMSLRAPKSGASFETIRGFLEANPSWPDRALLTRRAEEAIWASGDEAALRRWFANGKASTREGMIWLAEQAREQGREDEAAARLRRIWTDEAFAPEQETAFLSAYKDVLRTEDHIRRLDRLIWERRFGEAHRQLPRVPAEPRAVAEARIAMATMSRAAQNELLRVPKPLLNDPGLVYERARWLRRSHKEDQAVALLLAHEGDRPYPDLWWEEQAYLARDALSDGRISQAYGLASRHALTATANLAEAEWLAGWVAFQFLKDNAAAERHFQRLFDSVGTPISRARGAYWLGRVHAAAGDAAKAAQWFARAAEEPTAFYGQLAAAKTPEKAPAAPEQTIPKEAAAWAQRHELLAVLRLLDQSGEDRLFATFSRAFYNAARTDGERLAAVARVSELSISQGVRLSRLLRQHNVRETRIGYPLPNWMELPPSPPSALVLAVIRQESNFDVRAESSVGARGLMQLMPKTAEREARMMRQPYAPESLTQRPSLNVALGSHYLCRLLDRYDGHPALALAAYNAGESRVDQWLRNVGDPRGGDIDAITWIESIPFKETRNYVQRVLENAEIYRRRTGGAPVLPAEWARLPEETALAARQ